MFPRPWQPSQNQCSCHFFPSWSAQDPHSEAEDSLRHDWSWGSKEWQPWPPWNGSMHGVWYRVTGIQETPQHIFRPSVLLFMVVWGETGEGDRRISLLSKGAVASASTQAMVDFYFCVFLMYSSCMRKGSKRYPGQNAVLIIFIMHNLIGPLNYRYAINHYVTQKTRRMEGMLLITWPVTLWP